MTPTLEILIPASHPDTRLSWTVGSLAAQTDRDFEVLLSGSTEASLQIAEAINKLSGAGIAVRQIPAPRDLKRVELWNWLHAQARADWLKPLLPGNVLQPEYLARLRQRLAEKPSAQFVRCDAELQLEWGTETLRAPFTDACLVAAQVADYFPAKVDWLSRISNVAYARTAWLATGGFCNQLPGFASLNLNVTLALHHGVENLAEALVKVESADRLPLNESAGERVNFPLELWLVLRQARNYCLAAKVPWHCRWPWWRATTARLGHW